MSCWADEFDVPFWSLLDENNYEVYMYAKKKLGYLRTDLYFGTNEGWGEEYGDSIDYLNFQPQEITEEEYNILSKYSPSAVIDIYDRFIEILVDEYREYTNTNSDTPDSTDIESYKKMIDCLYSKQIEVILKNVNS